MRSGGRPAAADGGAPFAAGLASGRRELKPQPGQDATQMPPSRCRADLHPTCAPCSRTRVASSAGLRTGCVAISSQASQTVMQITPAGVSAVDTANSSVRPQLSHSGPTGQRLVSSRFTMPVTSAGLLWGGRPEPFLPDPGQVLEPPQADHRRPPGLADEGPKVRLELADPVADVDRMGGVEVLKLAEDEAKGLPILLRV